MSNVLTINERAEKRAFAKLFKYRLNFSRFYGAFANIYTLSDEQGNVFYVGMTTQEASARLQNHLVEARSDNGNNKKKNEIIRSLNYKIIATVHYSFWITGSTQRMALIRGEAIEKQWILKYINNGCALCNVKSTKP